MSELPWWIEVLLEIDGGITDMFLDPKTYLALLRRCQIVATVEP